MSVLIQNLYHRQNLRFSEMRFGEVRGSEWVRGGLEVQDEFDRLFSVFESHFLYMCTSSNILSSSPTIILLFSFSRFPPPHLFFLNPLKFPRFFSFFHGSCMIPKCFCDHKNIKPLAKILPSPAICRCSCWDFLERR